MRYAYNHKDCLPDREVYSIKTFLGFLIIAILSACDSGSTSHEEMIGLMEAQKLRYNTVGNYYASAAQVNYYDSMINATDSWQDKMRFTYNKSYALLALGREDEAIPLLEEQVERINREGIKGMNRLKIQLALAYLRAGERQNCVANHTAETCILPIRGGGIHLHQEGSRKAIAMYQELLSEYPDNLEYRWLLNIAYMTLGEYPDLVPPSYLLPGLDKPEDSKAATGVIEFSDMSGPLNLDLNNMAGGVIVDDFNNDGYLDIVTSSWDLDVGLHFFESNGDGTFTDRSKDSGLSDLTGGLNLLQTDFNNDGLKDIFVLRGAWLRADYGLQPNSLIKNNGDGTFTDVTTRSGLLSFHPTQTATWNDFNNDGWVDVFIGNETWDGNASSGDHPCELYINNGDETFRNVAKEAGCDVTGFIKGVVSGDYNNDGWQDIFVTSLSGERYLLQNLGSKSGVPAFQDVTQSSGIDARKARTFPAWFWDYNNDGALDIFAGDFTFELPISSYFAAESLDGRGTNGTMLIFHNNGDGTFEEVSEQLGTAKTAFAMSGNFGDIDNDGFLDFYLGTGNPELESIVPNKMFKSVEGKSFVDVTTKARVGHLQKGHAIAFADVNNDGSQDVFIEMGGAYKGDGFQNAFYVNPGQANANNWITIELEREGKKNIIGTRLKLTVTDAGVKRNIFRDVNSGGSFGASPLRCEIGLGKATVIERLEIAWHTGRIQVFENIQPNQYLRITEGSKKLETIVLKRLTFTNTKTNHHH